MLPSLILSGLKGKLPPLVNPDIVHDFVYVEDVTEAYLLAAAQSGQEPSAVYNVGAGGQITLREVVDIVRRILGINAEPEWGSMPNRQWDTNVWVAENKKIQEDLGWAPRYTFERGFCSMVNWLTDSPEILELYYRLRREAVSGAFC